MFSIEIELDAKSPTHQEARPCCVAGEFAEALKEYPKALDVNRHSSPAHYRVAELSFWQSNFQSAANEFWGALRRGAGAEVDGGLGADQFGKDL